MSIDMERDSLVPVDMPVLEGAAAEVRRLREELENARRRQEADAKSLRLLNDSLRAELDRTRREAQQVVKGLAEKIEELQGAELDRMCRFSWELPF